MGSGGLKKFFKKSGSTEEEILELVDNDENQLEETQREIISNIFEFGDTNAGDIMTHRTDIIAIENNSTLCDVVKLAIDNGKSRMPVFCDDLDNIQGIIYVKDLLKFVGTNISKDEKIENYCREPLFVPETIPLGKLFKQMTESRIQLAIVVDEYGGTAGLVTMEDILEELVGNIEDEYDEKIINIIKKSDDEYILDGITEIDDVETTLNIEIPEGDYDTIAGFVISQLGFLPGEDDEKSSVKYSNIVFTVLKVVDRRIEKIEARIIDDSNKES